MSTEFLVATRASRLRACIFLTSHRVDCSTAFAFEFDLLRLLWRVFNDVDFTSELETTVNSVNVLILEVVDEKSIETSNTRRRFAVVSVSTLEIMNSQSINASDAEREIVVINQSVDSDDVKWEAIVVSQSVDSNDAKWEVAIVSISTWETMNSQSVDASVSISELVDSQSVDESEAERDIVEVLEENVVASYSEMKSNWIIDAADKTEKLITKIDVEIISNDYLVIISFSVSLWSDEKRKNFKFKLTFWNRAELVKFSVCSLLKSVSSYAWFSIEFEMSQRLNILLLKYENYFNNVYWFNEQLTWTKRLKCNSHTCRLMFDSRVKILLQRRFLLRLNIEYWYLNRFRKFEFFRTRVEKIMILRSWLR